ncbi:MAG: hypothetical protein AAGM38_00395 [Pseudomonadota bacterium]
MKVILAANAEPGGGKTTLATTLASAAAAAGRQVALADASPQRASLAWLERRPAEAAAVLGVDFAALSRSRATARGGARSGGANRPSRRAASSSARAAQHADAWRDRLREAEREARRAEVDLLVIDAPVIDTALERARPRDLARALDGIDLVLAPATAARGQEEATRAFLALLAATPAALRGDAEALLIGNRIRRKRRPRAEALRRSLNRFAPEPAAEVSESPVYPMLADAGFGLFDPAAAAAFGARKTAKLREEWSPILIAAGLLAPPRLSRIGAAAATRRRAPSSRLNLAPAGV